MKVLLTGGSGDLGTVLAAALEAQGDIPLRLDIVAPRDQRGRPSHQGPGNAR